MNVFILGPAGSGKSLLTAGFALYLRSEGYKVKTVNLDPGVLNLGYEADFDVREKFTIEDIMRKDGLGPNGAILKAMDMLAETEPPEFSEVDYVLYDTPGQLEPFLFRDSGRRIVEKLEDCYCLFLGDLSVSRRNMLGFFLYALTVRYTLDVETLAILNKVDLLSPKEVREVKRLIEDPPRLFEKPENIRDELDMEVLKALRKFFPAQRVPLISAKTGKGYDELLTILHEVKCSCGDLT